MGTSTSRIAEFGRRHAGWLLLMLAYPLTHFIVRHIPNPFVPTANIALNMIFPVLAGYFYGPASGALAGLLGTGLAALLGSDIYDALSVLPHALMGFTAGLTGASRAQFTTSLTLLLGHSLNIAFYWRFDLLVFEHPQVLVLGLVTETTMGVVATMLLMLLLQQRLYRHVSQRW